MNWNKFQPHIPPSLLYSFNTISYKEQMLFPLVFFVLKSLIWQW